MLADAKYGNFSALSLLESSTQSDQVILTTLSSEAHFESGTIKCQSSENTGVDTTHTQIPKG